MIDPNPITASILTDDTLYIYTGPDDAWEVEHDFTTTQMHTADVAAAVGWPAVDHALRDVRAPGALLADLLAARSSRRARAGGAS